MADLGGFGDIATEAFSSSPDWAPYMHAQPPEMPAAPAGGGGWFSDLAGTIGSGAKEGLSAFGNIAKAALPIAQLGLGVQGAVTGAQAAGQLAKQSKIAERAAQTQEAAAAPLREFGTGQLQRAQAGQVPEAVQAQ